MNTETLFHIAFWFQFGALLLVRTLSAVGVQQAGERLTPDRAAIAREGASTFVARVLLFFLLIAWLVLYAINPPWIHGLDFPLPDWLRWLGFGIGLVSLGLLAWAQATLGKHWSPQLQLRNEHHLVTTGPYARVRHPLYSAAIGWAVGLAMLSANWVIAGLALLVVVGAVTRVPKEEQMMLEQFGEEYHAYMQRTGRYLPK